MNVSPHAAVVHGASSHPPNPAQQARAADPTAKGAAFGALVSQFARAKHAPATEPPIVPTTTTPVTTTTATTPDTTTPATTDTSTTPATTPPATTTDTSTTSIVV